VPYGTPKRDRQTAKPAAFESAPFLSGAKYGATEWDRGDRACALSKRDRQTAKPDAFESALTSNGAE